MIDVYIICGKQASDENVVFKVARDTNIDDMVITKEMQQIAKELKQTRDNIKGLQAVFIARSDEQKEYAKTKFLDVEVLAV